MSLTFSHDGTKLLTMGQDANHRIVMCVYLLGACALCHSHMRMRNRCYVPAASRYSCSRLPAAAEHGPQAERAERSRRYDLQSFERVAMVDGGSEQVSLVLQDRSPTAATTRKQSSCTHARWRMVYYQLA